MGLAKALSATLEAALASIEKDRPAAIQQLEAFINQVEGFAVPVTEELVLDAQEIIAVILAE
ncbi:MAG: hypothetical protein R3200_14660 [Xanthomonadales bacterium]|nr:hypothetical protein [Xanthomonadales bacterium]